MSNNVLHNRAGFTDLAGSGRLLLRTRYLDPLKIHSGSADKPAGGDSRTGSDTTKLETIMT